jgi:hypothetical protein
MQNTEPWILSAVLVLAFGGAGIFKYLAAREVACREGRDLFSVMAWTDWLKGKTRRARVLRNLAFIWFVIGLAVFVTLGQVFQD